jgi:hypothetical protein
MKEKCPNKGNWSTSKFTFSSVKECEHYKVESHDIKDDFLLHPKHHPNKFINIHNNKSWFI